MRSDQNTAKIPSKTFSAFLPIIRQDLIDADLRGGTYQLVARTICDFIDLNKKVEIGDETYHEGWTRWVSYNEIADAADIARRTVIYAINAMIEAKVLEKDQLAPRTRNKFRFAAYDKLHAEIEANPSIVQETHAYRFDPTSTSEPDALNDAVDAHSLDLKELKGPHPTGLGDSTGIADPMPTEEEGGDLKSSQKQENDGSLFLPEPVEEPKTSPKGKNAERLSPRCETVSPLSENSSNSSPQPSHNPDLKRSPPPASLDVIPNAHIGALVETLTESKTMNAAPTDEGLESFASAFNDAFGIASGAILAQPEATKAAKCKDFLEAILATAGLEMPPLLLFRKYCLTRTQALIENGELPEPPKWINYYSDTHTGKSIVEWAVSKAKSEHSASSNYQRTKVRLDQEKKQREAPREIPAETQAFLDKFQGRS